MRPPGVCNLIPSMFLFYTQGNMTLADIGLAEKRVYRAALNGNNSHPSVLHQKDD